MKTFRAIDAATGKQIFALQLGGYTGASAAIRDNAVYVGTFGNEVLGIDLGSGLPGGPTGIRPAVSLFIPRQP